MPQNIFGNMIVKGGEKQTTLNFSNARYKTNEQWQQMSDAQKKGVVVVEDYPIPEESDSVSVTADGVKTFGQLFNELYALVDTNKVTPTSVLTFNDTVWQRLEVTSNILEFSYCAIANNLPFISYVVIKSSNSSYTRFINNAVADSTSSVPTSGVTITFIYDYYKNLDIHTEYLAKNCMLTGGGNVEDAIKSLESSIIASGSQDLVLDNIAYGSINVSLSDKISNFKYIVVSFGDSHGSQKYTSTITMLGVDLDNPNYRFREPIFLSIFQAYGQIKRIGDSSIEIWLEHTSALTGTYPIHYKVYGFN